MNPLHVNSEIGQLKTVLLKRPGPELENLTPGTLGRYLFDDIPYLQAIQKEHDAFAKALAKHHIEVVYLEQLMTEALHDAQLKSKFVEQLLFEQQTTTFGLEKPLSQYLLQMPTAQMVEKIMGGIRKDEAGFAKGVHLHDMVESHHFFYLDPLPNLYFTRDPGAVIGSGIAINRLSQPARQLESIFLEHIIKNHPRFAEKKVPIWLDRHTRFPIEGGDILILSPEILAIGISERTTPQAIEILAKNLFKRHPRIQKLLAVQIQKTRAYMHLDTVFTMVDRDIFTIHPGILDAKKELNLYLLEPSLDPEHLHISHRTDLKATLKELLGLDDILLLPCGGGDKIAAAREQWNDGSNTLAIAPGVVVTYDRNYLSNEMLRQHGVQVIEIPGSELVRGRGGPRCMSMPLVREDL